MSQISLGTLTALVNSDDLHLIESDELRTEIPQYFDAMKTLQDQMALLQNWWGHRIGEIFRLVDLPGIDRMRLSDASITEIESQTDFYWLESDSGPVSFGESGTDLLRNEEAYDAFVFIWIVDMQLWEARNQILDQSRQLLNLIAHIEG